MFLKIIVDLKNPALKYADGNPDIVAVRECITDTFHTMYERARMRGFCTITNVDGNICGVLELEED